MVVGYWKSLLDLKKIQTSLLCPCTIWVETYRILTQVLKGKVKLGMNRKCRIKMQLSEKE